MDVPHGCDHRYVEISKVGATNIGYPYSWFVVGDSSANYSLRRQKDGD
jgi:hypothetical protein